MHYQLIESATLQADTGLVIGIFDDLNLPDTIQPISKSHRSLLQTLASKLTSEGDMLWQSDIEGCSVLLVHCGAQANYSAERLLKRLQDIISALLSSPVKQACIALPQVSQRTKAWQATRMILAIDAQCFQYLDFKSNPKKTVHLESIELVLSDTNPEILSTALAIAEGVQFSRTLSNCPANVCTPDFLAQQAKACAKSHKSLRVKVHEEKAIRKLGMGGLLAVAKGSQEPPKFIEIHYKGASDSPPIVLIGKGITFDSGGLSLKPPDAMPEMKYDMAGAATVLGTLKACALLKLPLNVIGLIAAAENMPSGHAVKPGDIITTLSGQTVEITNTDAEGRLILADALTFAERLNPRFVLDIATLTGAIIVSLGHVYTGFMTKEETLAHQIEQAARDSLDKAWRLPLDEAYEDTLDSPIADMINAPFNRGAGSITAAMFLARFTGKYPWAHLDIAGTAWVSGKQHHATGRPIPLLMELLRHATHPG